MNEGPTTVGSIVGKVKMDRDQWVVDVAKTKQDARELDALRPDIHIGDNAAAVIARLKAAEAATESLAAKQETASTRTVTATAAVTRAERGVAAGLQAAALAAEQARAAQVRLDEARDAGDATRVALAEADLARWTRQSEEANEAAARSHLELAAAQKAQAAAAARVNEANKTSATRVGMIASAIALLVPLLTPVASTAIGLGGAFLGMGAAGVAAIFGIKSEMEKGTDVGNAYRAGINTLRGDMSTLAQTAAVGMLASFRRAVADTNAAMPMLNKQVGQFSSLLGEAGAAGLSGTISSLRVLNPLFMTAGIYARSLAQGFEQWASGSGIEQFNGYALATFPQVVDVLGKLASMVMHILEALAPLGTVGLAVLSGIADVISSIPVDILSQLIVSLTWGALAFKAWGFVAPMLSAIATSMGAVGAATTIATGPIGWVVAGLSALAGIFAVTIASNQSATRALQDYTAAVDADSGAIGKNVRAKVAQELQDRGALDAAKKLGIGLSTLTDAVLGNADAQSQLSMYTTTSSMDQEALKRIVDKTGLSVKDASDASKTLTSALQQEGPAVQTAVSAWQMRQDAISETTSVTREQEQADEAAAAALGITVGAIQAARAGQKDMTADTAKATAEMYLQNDAAGLLKQSLDLLNGKTLTAAEAQNRFDSTIANMGAHIDKSGKDVERATASLEGMSAAAVANRGELISSVQAAQQSAQAFRDNGGSADEARQKLADMKQAIIDHAVEVGEDRDQVQQFIDKIFQIPASVPPTKLEVDAQEALEKAQKVKDILDALQRNVTVEVSLRGGGGQKLAFANGGTARGLANGGGTVTGPGTAGSDTAGIYRLAHGEEVISNVFGQADRWRSTLKAINAGATTAGTAPALPSSPTSPTTPERSAVNVQVDVHVSVVKSEDPQIVGNMVGRGVRDALSGVKL